MNRCLAWNSLIPGAGSTAGTVRREPHPKWLLLEAGKKVVAKQVMLLVYNM